MKILFDCIVTKHPANMCSTTIQFMRLTQRLLQLPNVYIYWPIPEWSDETSGYPVSDRIKYFKVPQSNDRTREYNFVRPWLEEAISFAGPYWDWDILITVRTAQVPMLKVMSISPRQKGRQEWTKRVYLLEEMPIISEKKTVSQSSPDVQDRMAIEGYLAADAVFIPSYHEKAMVLKVAKDHFTPSRLLDLRSKVKEVCLLSTGVFELKDAYKWRPSCGRKLTVAFVGRLEAVAAMLDTVGSLMKNLFILKGDTLACKVLSISAPGVRGEKFFDKDAVDILHLDRDAFWAMARQELDVGVYFHVDGGLLMSIFEPVSFGMPAIVRDASWSRSVFGDSYPFYATSEVQAYGLVAAFTEDYEGMYAKFSKWYTEWFVPTYTKRLQEDNLYTLLMGLITTPTEESEKDLGNLKNNEIVRLLAEHGGEDFVLLDLIQSLGKTHLRTLASKVDKAHDELGLVWSTSWNDFRLALIEYFGYVDAGVSTGHLRKAKP